MLNIALVAIYYCLWYYIENTCLCYNTYHDTKETTGNMLKNRQTDEHCQSRVLLLFKFYNWFALLWTPYVYHDIQICIFTPCLFLQWVFDNFQCVISLICSSGCIFFMLLLPNATCCNATIEAYLPCPTSISSESLRFCTEV